jgi:hypothetical protein
LTLANGDVYKRFCGSTFSFVNQAHVVGPESDVNVCAQLCSGFTLKSQQDHTNDFCYGAAFEKATGICTTWTTLGEGLMVPDSGLDCVMRFA